jgi:hypothetical protein
MHDLSNVYLVSDKLERVSNDDIKIAETRPGSMFPSGYREYVLQPGVGMYCDYLYVFPPQRIVKEAATYQQIFQKYSYLWSREKARTARATTTISKTI